MKVNLSPQAQGELEDACDYYAQVASPQLAASLLTEFERAVEQLTRHPDLGTMEARSTAGIRWTTLRNFPYSVYYRNKPGEIEILVLAHQRRRPGYWK